MDESGELGLGQSVSRARPVQLEEEENPFGLDWAAVWRATSLGPGSGSSSVSGGDSGNTNT